MIRTYYRDKLAWKLFDMNTMKDVGRGIRKKFSGGKNYEDFETPEAGTFTAVTKPVAAGFYPGVKHASADWFTTVAPLAAGLGTGMFTWKHLPGATPVAKAGAAILTGLAAGGVTDYMLSRLVPPANYEDQHRKREEAQYIARTQPDYLGSAILGSGLGALTGAGLGYAAGDSAGLVPGALAGAGLGGYLGYKYPDWAGTSI